jgi:acetyl esterase/lipase
MLISPWFDMDKTLSASSYDTNAGTDLIFTRPMVRNLIDLYLPGDVSGTDPRVNAFYADLSGLPPTYVQVGGGENLLGESERFTALADKSGVPVRLDVFPGRLHTFQMAAGESPVADDAIGRFATWLRPRLGL